jgi:hypothetical protein
MANRSGLYSIRRHLLPLSFLLAAGWVFCWFVTQGDWRLFQSDPFGQYYDALAQSIRHGRLDVPPEAIGAEAFIRDGHYYGYFGMTPALFRLPFNSLIPSMWGRWSRLSILLACLASLVITYRIVLQFLTQPRGYNLARSDRLLIGVFLTSAGVGSTLVFLTSRAIVYHEAAAWGSTLALGSAGELFVYLADGRRRNLAAAGALAFLGVFARPTAAAGALLALAVVALLLLGKAAASTQRPSAWRRWIDLMPSTLSTSTPARLRSDGLMMLAMVTITVACYLATNYAKFRTFDGVPVKYYVEYIKSPRRMALTGGHQIHPENFRTCFTAYFLRKGLQVRREFPWLFMPEGFHLFPEARIDYVEQSSTVPMSMPWLLAAAIAGGALIVWPPHPIFRAARLPVLGLAAGGCVVLVTVGITERYMHDMYPALLFAGAAGLSGLLGTRGKVRFIGGAALAAMGLFAICANVAFTLEYQRELVWGVPAEKREEFHRWREFFGPANPHLNAPATGESLPAPARDPLTENHLDCDAIKRSVASTGYAKTVRAEPGHSLLHRAPVAAGLQDPPRLAASDSYRI